MFWLVHNTVTFTILEAKVDASSLEIVIWNISQSPFKTLIRLVKVRHIKVALHTTSAFILSRTGTHTESKVIVTMFISPTFSSSSAGSTPTLLSVLPQISIACSFKSGFHYCFYRLSLLVFSLSCLFFFTTLIKCLQVNNEINVNVGITVQRHFCYYYNLVVGFFLFFLDSSNALTLRDVGLIVMLTRCFVGIYMNFRHR